MTKFLISLLPKLMFYIVNTFQTIKNNKKLFLKIILEFN